MSGGSTTKRGGRQKGTPNKATLAKQKAMSLGKAALDALQSGDANSINKVRDAIANNEHALDADAADGTMTEADAMVSTALRENKRYNTALEYLQDTYRDNRLPRMIRQDAAKAAIRYETPALSNVAVQQEPDNDKIFRDADKRREIGDIVDSVLVKAGIKKQTTVTDVIIDAELFVDGDDKTNEQ